MQTVNPVHLLLDYEQSLFFLDASRKTPETRNRVSRLRRSTLARACTLLTKSEENERLLAV